MLWVTAKLCYSDAKSQHLLCENLFYYLFKFSSLSIRLSLEQTSILQYFVSYSVNLKVKTIFCFKVFYNSNFSEIYTVSLKSDKVKLLPVFYNDRNGLGIAYLFRHTHSLLNSNFAHIEEIKIFLPGVSDWQLLCLKNIVYVFFNSVSSAPRQCPAQTDAS